MKTPSRAYTYDPEADAIFMRISEEAPHEAFEAMDGVILHLDNQNRLQGIEINSASRVAPALVPASEASFRAAE
jgi:uncharacterized protein YuzE